MRFRFFMDHKKSIFVEFLFVEYLRSLLVMVEQNYTYESVFSLSADRPVWVHKR